MPHKHEEKVKTPCRSSPAPSAAAARSCSLEATLGLGDKENTVGRCFSGIDRDVYEARRAELHACAFYLKCYRLQLPDRLVESIIFLCFEVDTGGTEVLPEPL